MSGPRPLEIYAANLCGMGWLATLYDADAGRVLFDAKGETREAAIKRLRWLKSYSRVARRRVVEAGRPCAVPA